MLGNEAFARGLFEAGCEFVSSYPGTPSTEVTEYAAKYDELYAEWAPNEKVAMEAALGASIAGKRSFCGMKHVGLNVAADPLYTAGYTGVNGGMVICVADDPGLHSSQNEQDSRHHAIASKVMMVDSAFCTVGTANLNSRSLRYDYETNAFIFAPSTTNQLNSMFERDKKNSTLLTPEMWKKRSGWKKFLGWVGNLLTPFL